MGIQRKRKNNKRITKTVKNSRKKNEQSIKENGSRILTPVDYLRQRDLFNPESIFEGKVKIKDIPIAIIGAGNIGSNTAIALTKMGLLNLTIFDKDIIEAHNLSSQAYREADCDKKKVVALVDILREVNSSTKSRGIPRHAKGDEFKKEYHIIISAVDGLLTRKKLAIEIQATCPPDTVIIDGRMGGLQIEVHTTNAKEWHGILPKKVDSDPCSARYISFTAYSIAGVIANNVRQILTKKDVTSTFVFNFEMMMSMKK